MPKIQSPYEGFNFTLPEIANCDIQATSFKHTEDRPHKIQSVLWVAQSGHESRNSWDDLGFFCGVSMPCKTVVIVWQKDNVTRSLKRKLVPPETRLITSLSKLRRRNVVNDHIEILEQGLPSQQDSGAHHDWSTISDIYSSELNLQSAASCGLYSLAFLSMAILPICLLFSPITIAATKSNKFITGIRQWYCLSRSVLNFMFDFGSLLLMNYPINSSMISFMANSRSLRQWKYVDVCLVKTSLDAPWDSSIHHTCVVEIGVSAKPVV